MVDDGDGYRGEFTWKNISSSSSVREEEEEEEEGISKSFSIGGRGFMFIGEALGVLGDGKENAVGVGVVGVRGEEEEEVGENIGDVQPASGERGKGTMVGFGCKSNGLGALLRRLSELLRGGGVGKRDEMLVISSESFLMVVLLVVVVPSALFLAARLLSDFVRSLASASASELGGRFLDLLCSEESGKANLTVA